LLDCFDETLFRDLGSGFVVVQY